MSRLSGDLLERVVALLQEGASNREVERQTGVSRMTASRYRKRLGLPGWFITASSPACRHGHPFPQNLGRNNRGHLICLECVRASNRAAQQRAYTPAEPDEAAVERAVSGDLSLRLTARERQAAVARLDKRGWAAAAIADHLGCSERTVRRARARAREALDGIAC